MSNLVISNVKNLKSSAVRASELLTTMSNKHRLLILCRLVEGEVQAGALAEGSGLSQSALSQHLARLRQAGIVATRREGQIIHYRLASPEAKAVLKTLYRIYCA